MDTETFDKLANSESLVLIKATGEVLTLEDKQLSLEEAQGMVGGDVQLVTFKNKEGKRRLILCDEEGKLKDYPINTTATAMWDEVFKNSGDCLVGNIIVCSQKHFN